MKERNGYLFVAEHREAKLDQFTGRLDRLSTLVDWQGLARAVNKATGREGPRPKGGRPPTRQKRYSRSSSSSNSTATCPTKRWSTACSIA